MRAGRWPGPRVRYDMDRVYPLASRAALQGARGCTVASIAALGLFVGPHNVRADEPIAAPKCAMHLSVEVSPEVPNPSDAGFLSSLLGNHAGYQLFLLRVASDTRVELQLQGPGPDERCQEVVDAMSDDGRVESIDVI